jgi:transcription-repair coupling factor (superfamily II helicase)
VKLTVDGKERDCLLLLYRDGDKLYVPVEQLDRVQKYSVEESAPPALNKLGGSGWERLKQQTKRAIFEMAEELVTLYAERKARPGYAFSSDTPWQKELEASFIYQETPDQLTATDDVKNDLECSTPMDRLICGDVGYGKTEVAMRAAFKVVQDGKQVAVLVPTTILAQQHYETFRERMMPFPVCIEVLSRFRTQKEQDAVIKGLSSGSVDIVIGTHRLLSEDVHFKDLGLVIIDEEQRFGVRHKEKLKQLRRQVDVMAMTATPIPRTLHMALLGTRDMSIINTPPKDRLPILTEILPFDEHRIADAILREVDRGGQVYFVHNRVQSIDSMAEFLRELLPQVRFAVAHGQMPERQLERIMLDFLLRRYDCLVATMIIESGLDIPNVNTIIINRADRFGLSQLYQIRGRVGRSNRRAYAYLIVPPRKVLPKTAQRRLLAIEEFSDLGSGFSIAMRDLEIRGAGNLLGAQQHGFIAAVGFDLYCRLLDEAIHQLKGEEVEQIPDPDLHIAASAYLPDEYVHDAEQKVGLYQRLAAARSTAALLEIEEEMRDRYGRCPPQTVALLDLIQVKILARQIRAVAVDIDDIRLRLILPQDWQPPRQKIEEMIRRSPALLNFSFGKENTVTASLEGETDYERLEFARTVLQEMV